MNGTLAITMWDFSWLERRWPGAGFEDWDRALDELKARGYDAVRIDPFPHLLAQDPNKEWELVPLWDQQTWGSPARNHVRIQPDLTGFIHKCKDRGILVGLSGWYRQDTEDSSLLLTTPEKHAQSWIKTLEIIAQEGLLDGILYVDMCNEWPLEVWCPYFLCKEEERHWMSPSSLAWMREAVTAVRQRFPSLKYCFSFTHDLDQWKGVDLSFFDLLELHIWMAECSDDEFFRRVGYGYERFSSVGYDNLAKNGEKLYRATPEYWLGKLKDRIQDAAEWSKASGLPLITTECWSVVDYKDWPLLHWDWIKEINAFAVNEAMATGRWIAVGTSNFCAPQFRGMWEDVQWHKRQTDVIHGKGHV